MRAAFYFYEGEGYEAYKAKTKFDTDAMNKADREGKGELGKGLTSLGKQGAVSIQHE